MVSGFRLFPNNGIATFSGIEVNNDITGNVGGDCVYANWIIENPTLHAIPGAGRAAGFAMACNHTGANP